MGMVEFEISNSKNSKHNRKVCEVFREKYNIRDKKDGIVGYFSSTLWIPYL